MKYAWFIICSIFIMCTSVVYSQTDLSFEYSNIEKLKTPVHCRVKLQFPNGSIDNLYSDTVWRFQNVKTGYFKQSGDYLLTVNFTIGDSINETTDYGFTLNNKEINVAIYVSYEYFWTVNENIHWDGKPKIPMGSICIAKTYNSLESISIVLDSTKSSKYCSGPFFRLTNNSKDTLYGNYSPGYFWGTRGYHMFLEYFVYTPLSFTLYILSKGKIINL